MNSGCIITTTLLFCVVCFWLALVGNGDKGFLYLRVQVEGTAATECTWHRYVLCILYMFHPRLVLPALEACLLAWFPTPNLRIFG